LILRILKLFISILVYCSDQFKILSRKISGRKIPPKYIVLYYHAVRQEQRERFAKQLDAILSLSKPFHLDNEYPDVNGSHHVAITFDDGFASFLQYALPELGKRGMPFTMFVPTGYIGQPPGWIKTGSQRFQPERIMNEEELRKLSRLKIAAIGSHCLTHRNLENLTEDEARDEISHSKTDLERILGKKVITLSFPHGGFHRTHIAYAREAGYERVFSIIPAPAFETENEYITGRINCDPNDWLLEFRLKLLGAYRWRRSASNMKAWLRQIFHHSVQ